VGSTYDSSPLQPTLFAPVHQTALQLAAHLVPDARRVLDVGCGTGRLLRQVRQRYRPAELVGVDLARGMLAAAIAATTTELRIHYLHAGAEHLPFTDEMFDLVFATMTMRHWTDQAAGIAEIGRVLTPGGVLVLADVFPSSPRRTLLASLLLRPSSTQSPWAARCRTDRPSPDARRLRPHPLVQPARCSSRRDATAEHGQAPSREWGGRAEWGRFARFHHQRDATDNSGPESVLAGLSNDRHGRRSYADPQPPWPRSSAEAVGGERAAVHRGFVAAPISSSRAAVMATSRPAITCW